MDLTGQSGFHAYRRDVRLQKLNAVSEQGTNAHVGAGLSMKCRKPHLLNEAHLITQVILLCNVWLTAEISSAV